MVSPFRTGRQAVSVPRIPPFSVTRITAKLLRANAGRHTSGNRLGTKDLMSNPLPEKSLKLRRGRRLRFGKRPAILPRLSEVPLPARNPDNLYQLYRMLGVGASIIFSLMFA